MDLRHHGAVTPPDAARPTRAQRDYEQELIGRYVAPFYLKMMRHNAIGQPSEMLAAIAAGADSASPEDVVLLLCGHWRTSVMGAWMAVRHRSEDMADALLASLRASEGSLNSPALATACVLVLGAGAADALAEYITNDHAETWGSAAFAAAAWESISGGAVHPLATDGGRRALPQMMRVAQELRSVEALIR